MKTAILSCGALLALTAGVASAGAGVNIRWDNCFGDAGVSDKTFACDTNTGSDALAVSFELPANLPHGGAVQVLVDLATEGAWLPEWWKFFNAGNCRQIALSAVAQDGTACPDWAVGQASVAIAGYNEGFGGGPNTANINIVNGVSLDQAQDLFAGQEYGVVKLTIQHAKSVGTGSCAGCTVAACIIVQSVRMYSFDEGGAVRFWVDGPTNGTNSNFVTWQGGQGITVGEGWYVRTGCPESVPVRKSTWGAVKALYR